MNWFKLNEFKQRREHFMRNSKREKQKEIIDTALQLFLEKGYEKTSIKDITEKMNIATGLFHYYFNSKENALI